MNIPIGLSLEQMFNLRIYESQIKGLSQEESQNYLLEVLRQLKDNLIK
jgi:Phycobilisome degradation protein nblA